MHPYPFFYLILNPANQLGVHPDKVCWEDLFQAMVRCCCQFARNVNQQFKYHSLSNL